MLSLRSWSVLNTLGLIAMITVNALANALPINNLNTGQVSDLYPSLFTPAGVTFSIWAVIYTLLIGFGILQLLQVYTRNYFVQLSKWFVLSCLANVSWILAWHHLLPGLSVALMLVLLYSLIHIFLLLNEKPVTTIPEKAFVRLPFTIYFAWICVATIANVAAWLVSLGVSLPFTPDFWTIAMMTIATALAFFITLKYQAPAFALVVVWALFGIFLRWQQTEVSHIATMAVIYMVLLSSIYIYTSQRVLRKLRK